MHIRLIGNSELFVGVNVNVRVSVLTTPLTGYLFRVPSKGLFFFFLILCPFEVMSQLDKAASPHCLKNKSKLSLKSRFCI